MSLRARVALVSLVMVFVAGLAVLVSSSLRPSPATPSPTGATGSRSAPPGTETPSGPPSGSPGDSVTASGGPTGRTVTWTRLASEGVAPVARQAATWTVDPGTGIAYLYGGTTGGIGPDGEPAAGSTLGDLWAYDLAADSWEPVVGTSDEPPPRSGHSAAWVDGVGVVVVGGRDGAGRPLADIWRFDPNDSSWRALSPAGPALPARSGACAAAAADGRLWVSHGLGAQGPLDDTWRYEVQANRWRSLDAQTPPSARSGQACWIDAAGRFVLFAGRSGDTFAGDLWATGTGTDGAGSWSRLGAEGGLSPRTGSAVAVHTDEAVLVGGVDEGGTPLGDVGVVGSGADAIAPVTATGPAPDPRTGAVLVDDPAAERLVLFGGATSAGASDELWQADLR
jgi:galactose oxidase-like protein